MKQRTSALLTLGLCLVLGLVALILALSGGKREKSSAQTTQAAQVILTPAPTQDPAAPVAQEEETSENTETKTGFFKSLFQKASPTPAATPIVIATTVPTVKPVSEPIVTERPTAAAEDYFDDAAFIGGDVVMGLDMYDYNDVLSGADFYASEDVTLKNVQDCLEQMEGQTYGKVYVGLGMDDLTSDTDTLRLEFSNLIDSLREQDPDALIYLMSVTPVSEYKSGSSSYTMERVQSCNELMQELARDKDVYYLDVLSVLCNEDGYLPSDVTVDGIHFTPAHYSAWFDYLQTHYVGGASQSAETEVSAVPVETESAPET
jgi:hypothetical protein